MRKPIFYFLLAIPIIIWVISVLVYYITGDETIPSALVRFVIDSFAFVKADLSILGEATPAVLAGSIIALHPNIEERTDILAVILAVVSYLLFVHLTIFFYDGPGAAFISTAPGDVQKNRMTVLGLIGSIRTMAITLVAAMIGLRLKPKRQSNS